MSRLRHVVEIGASDSGASRALSWATHADKVSLYEPNDLLRADLARAAQGLDNVIVHPEAVSDTADPSHLVHLGRASYLIDQPSFLATSIEPEGTLFLRPLIRVVSVMTINQAVTEDVDLLIVTIGGGESRLLRAMTARPRVVETAHYCHNARQWEDTYATIGFLEVAGYRGTTIASNQYGTHHRIRWTLTR